jgi:lipopolysaccharide transport system permease protein
VNYILPFLTQLWLLVTPVAYSQSVVDEKWQWLYALNPMVGVVEGFRWALLDAPAPNIQTLAISTAITIIVLVSGMYYFRRMERTFADLV